MKQTAPSKSVIPAHAGILRKNPLDSSVRWNDGVKAFCASIFLLLVASCTVGPDYKLPDIGMPQDWLSVGKSEVPDQTHITLQKEWWENFHDPALNELIELTLAQNFDLKIAQDHIKEARAARSAARSELLPFANAQVADTREANVLAFPGEPAAVMKPFSVYQADFDASWELDLFGGTRRNIEAAGAQLAANEASADDMTISLLAEVARDYIDARQYQRQIALAEATTRSYADNAGIARQRYESGDTARIDLTRAEAQLEQEQAQVPYYRNLLAQTEFNLDVLIGEQPGAAAKIIGGFEPIPTIDEHVVLAAPMQVIEARPDIRAAERTLAQATAQQGVATAALFPNISLSGMLGVLSTDKSNLFEWASRSWSAGANVTLPVLNYGRVLPNLHASEARRDEALAQYQKHVVAALSDVERALTAYIEQNAYHAKLAKAAADSQRAMDISSMRYKEGLTSFIDVIDAQRTLYGIQSQLAQSDALQAQNLVSVYKSLGGGWEIK